MKIFKQDLLPPSREDESSVTFTTHDRPPSCAVLIDLEMLAQGAPIDECTSIKSPKREPPNLSELSKDEIWAKIRERKKNPQ